LTAVFNSTSSSSSSEDSTFYCLFYVDESIFFCAYAYSSNVLFWAVEFVYPYAPFFLFFYKKAEIPFFSDMF
jgi:hypothetical protein